MKLDQYLQESHIPARQFATTLGVHVSQVSRWASGDRTPSIDQAARIKEATGGRVTFEDFVQSSMGAE